MNKKVLFIGSYNVSTNVSIAEIELICGLSKKGLQIEVYSNFSEESKDIFESNGIKTIQGSIPSGIDRLFMKHIRNLQKENQYDIIHCYHSRILRNVILSVKKSSVKLVTYLGASSVYWHDPFAYLSFLNKRVDAIICNSRYVLNHLQKQFRTKNRKNRASLIYKGYDPSWFKDVETFDLSSLNIPKDAIVVSLAATFMRQKGIKYYIESSKYLPKNLKVYYILMGSMTDNATVKKWIASTPHPERFKVLGYREDVKAIIKASDIYIQSSLKEGFGRSLSEAVSLEKPVIITETGGFTELVEHQKSGMIVPIKNSKAIAKAIIYLKDKKTRTTIGKLAKTRLETDFNIQNTIDNTYKLYQTLLH